MGDALLLFNISRPRPLIELSNVAQMASRTLAENSPNRKSILRTHRALTEQGRDARKSRGTGAKRRDYA
jgi:hypothetical protein